MSKAKNNGGIGTTSATAAQKNMSFDTKTRKLIELPGSSVSEGTALVAALGMNTSQRKKKAEAQPRDGGGRWVSAGANVRWNSNGQKWAGTVEAVKNGKAIVKVRHADGSESMTTLMPSTLDVMKSKARLGSAAKKYHDWQNESNNWIGEHKGELAEAAEGDGVLVEREDGYSFEVKKRKDRDEGNPLVYQLYSPTGMSLGIYDEAVEKEIDEIFEDDKDPVEGGAGDTGGEEGGETPAPGGEGEGGGEAPAAPAAPSAPAGVAASGVVVASVDNRPYSVPKVIQEAVLSALEAPLGLPEKDLTHAKALCSGDPVSLADVEWVYSFFESIKDIVDFYGGNPGQKWANKIMDKVEVDEPSIYEPINHDFEADSLEYFAVSDNVTDADNFYGLIGVNFTTSEVFIWDGTTFTGPIGDAETFNAEYIEPLDDITAREVAYQIHEHRALGDASNFSLVSHNPEERNLFALAESELDFNEMDRIASLNYDGYDRAKDATKQARGQGGKFGEVPSDPAPPVAPDKAPEADASASVAQAAQAAEGAADPMAAAKYFAIVDDVDQSAVLEIVAVTQVAGAPAAFRRTMGTWSPDADMLQSLNSPTPPTIVSLDEVDEIKDVLSQVDTYDSGKDAVTASLAVRGFSMVDGSYRILSVDDLVDAVNQTTTLSSTPEDIVDHITKRARALNRLDVVPEFWRVSGQLTANTNLIGEYGEIILASGAPVGATSLQQLESYWLRGAGAEKISWGSEGDISRAHKTFTKYLGLERAYGFATILHNKASKGE